MNYATTYVAWNRRWSHDSRSGSGSENRIAWNRLETRFLKSRVWNRCGNSRFEVGIVRFTDRKRLLHCRASVREEDETHVFV